MNVSKLREMDVVTLEEQLINLREELFKLRMQYASRQLNQTHLLKQARRNIAKVKTILTEKASIENE